MTIPEQLNPMDVAEIDIQQAQLLLEAGTATFVDVRDPNSFQADGVRREHPHWCRSYTSCFRLGDPVRTSVRPSRKASPRTPRRRNHRSANCGSRVGSRPRRAIPPTPTTRPSARGTTMVVLLIDDD